MSESHVFLRTVEQAAQRDPSVLKIPSNNRQRPTEQVGLLLDGVPETPVAWLWRDRIPRGGLTVLDGDPGCGKSLLTLELAARVSRGYPLAGERDFTEAGGVVLLTAEDSLSHVVRPRLRAANADLSRVLAVPYTPDYQGQTTISRLPADLSVLRRAIERVNAKLAIFDVLVCYIPTSLNTNRDQDVRLALAPLAELADLTGVAVILIRHLNKTTGVNPIYRGGGSVGIIGAARSGLLLAADPNVPERRVLATVKSNLGIPASSLTFRIVTKENIPTIEWIGNSTQTAEGLLAPPASKEEKSALTEAMDFLKEELRDRPLESVRLMQSARAQGIAERTLHRAKDALEIKSAKRDGKWFWRLEGCQDVPMP